MYSSNDKLIDEVRKRLLSIKKHNFNYHINQNSINYAETRRLSTLIPRRLSVNRRSTIRKKTQTLINEEKLNLRLIPLIRTAKNLLKIWDLNEKIVTTQPFDNNFSRNKKLYLKKPKIESNYNIYINMNTFSNNISTSNSLGKHRSHPNKKKLFLSPYQLGKNRKKLFKNLVSLSKDIHSPKKRENYIDKENFNLISYINLNENKKIEKSNKEEIFGLSHQLLSTNKFKIKKGILKDIHNLKTESLGKNKNILNKIRFQNNGLKLGKNAFLRKIIHNKENKKRINCYYNKMHLNKIQNILEKYSYNNMD